MTRSSLFLFSLLLLLTACGDGSDAAVSAAASTPPNCVVAPAPILNFHFYTLRPGSAMNGQPLTGAFSTSLGRVCTPQNEPCLLVENIRLNEASLVGFGETIGVSTDLRHGSAALRFAGPASFRLFRGTVTIDTNQVRFDVVDESDGTTLVLIGDTSP